MIDSTTFIINYIYFKQWQLDNVDCWAVFLTVEIVEGQKICHVVIASELDQQKATKWSVLSSCLALILSNDQFQKYL